MSTTKRRIWSTIAVTFAVAISVAAMTATEAIKERHEAMEGVRDNMMILGAMVKKAQPFDAQVVHDSAAKIAENFSRAADLFPEGSDTGDVKTWAKPEIWTDRANFDKLLDAAHQAAVDLQSVENADELPAALGKLGNDCKSCHDVYRLPKK